MKKLNYTWLLFGLSLVFPTFSFSGDPLKNFEIALTNQSRKEGRVGINVMLDNKPLIKDSYFEYHQDPMTDLPDKRHHFTVSTGNHVIKVTAKNGKHIFSFPIVVGEKGLYIDLRYQDESPKKETNYYNDGRVVIQEGHFFLVMAPQGLIGYD